MIESFILPLMVVSVVSVLMGVQAGEGGLIGGLSISLVILTSQNLIGDWGVLVGLLILVFYWIYDNQDQIKNMSVRGDGI